MKKIFLKLLFPLLSLFFCIPVQFAAADTLQGIRIHYLGHAGFILQFDNGIGMVADYASFHDIGDFKPDIATYSHGHDDHAGGILPKDVDRDHILTNTESLKMDGIVLHPLITSETSAGSNDNSSYLITYKEVNILHMGDAQGDISEIESPDVRAHLKALFPDKIDLLLMPIGNSGQRRITNEEVAEFIDFLHPSMVIPMHYWSFWGKRSFLKYMEKRNRGNGNRYKITKVDGPQYAMDSSLPRKDDAITIISLEGSDY